MGALALYLDFVNLFLFMLQDLRQQPLIPAVAERGGARHSPWTRASAPAERADVVVIGGGIVGLATALRLLEQRPDLRVVVLEKERDPGHPPDRPQQRRRPRRAVLPARVAQGDALPRGQGRAGALLRAARHPARTERQARRRHSTRPSCRASRRSRSAPWPTACPGSRRSARSASREIEPHAAGIRALWSPGTGIVDFLRVAAAYADDVRATGGLIETSRAGRRPSTQRGDEMVVGTVARRPGGAPGHRLRRAAGRPGRRDDRRDDAPSGRASCPSGATTTR